MTDLSAQPATNPAEAAAVAFAAAETAYHLGDVNKAMRQYLTALVNDPGQGRYRRKALESLNMVKGYKTLPGSVMRALEICATDPTLDLQPLARISAALLRDDPRIEKAQELLSGPISVFAQAISDQSLDWLLSHKLLIGALRNALVCDEDLETTLTSLRRQVTLLAANGEAWTAFQPYCATLTALARQCIVTRHIWCERHDERGHLAKAIQSNEISPAERALLRCLYEPLSELTAEEIASLPLLLSEIVSHRTREKELAEALPEVTTISAGLSNLMKAQYEGFPYPPWKQYGNSQAMTLRQFLHVFSPPLTHPLPTAGIFDILVAGCGTGRFTNELARLLPFARIRAVDLSRTSLGYAARMAEYNGVKNVSFGVADIRMLGEVPKRFSLIECGGVLHHMANPSEGLQVLRDLLLPGGLLRLALYSDRARADVVLARDFVSENHFEDSIGGLRTARQAILGLQKSNPIRRVARRPDFYSADSLHDLVFNVHEIRFTPLSMKNMFAELGLIFLGMAVDNPKRRVQYLDANPDDPHCRDLDKWDEFEKEYPDTFNGMFQMWLQKPLSTS